MYKSEELITSAQDYTNSWVDFGSKIETHGGQTLGVFIVNDLNSGSGLQLQALGINTFSTTEFNLPIYTISATAAAVDEEVMTFPDADTGYVLGITLDRVIPYVQLQIKATDAGSTAQADEGVYTLWG